MTIKPYAEVTSLAYGEQAANAFDLSRPRPRTVVLRGLCPRCGHTMEYISSDRLVRGWLRSVPRRPDLRPDVEETMICTCDLDHTGRPDGFVGCGAYWKLRIAPE